MKVIGAGLPLTATATTASALEELGFGPCHHMGVLMADLGGQLPRWERLARGEGGQLLDEILDGYESCAGWPAARYHAELADRHPDAKVLLTVRAAQDWVRAIRETLWSTCFGDSVIRHVSAARAAVDDDWRRLLELVEHVTWAPRTGALAGGEDPGELAASMERWNEAVRASIPSERLLVWDPGDGWAPLCELLGVAVPDTPLQLLDEAPAFRQDVLGGGLDALEAWWDRRERPSHSLHGTAA